MPGQPRLVFLDRGEGQGHTLPSKRTKFARIFRFSGQAFPPRSKSLKTGKYILKFWSHYSLNSRYDPVIRQSSYRFGGRSLTRVDLFALFCCFAFLFYASSYLNITSRWGSLPSLIKYLAVDWRQAWQNATFRHLSIRGGFPIKVTEYSSGTDRFWQFSLKI